MTTTMLVICFVVGFELSLLFILFLVLGFHANQIKKLQAVFNQLSQLKDPPAQNLTVNFQHMKEQIREVVNEVIKESAT